MNQFFIFALLSIALAPLGWAAETTPKLEANIEIPRLSVSEYHRPYVAVWVQDEQRRVVATLAVWYQQPARGKEEGTKWLPDLRQWWRRAGRSAALPLDGISGATRPAGRHELKLSSKGSWLGELKAGEYELLVEAAREVGGRELLQLPFTWPVDKPTTTTVAGTSELGEVSLRLTP